MSRSYYSEINLHLTWHTKESAPLLTPRVEPVTHRLLRERIEKTEGVFVHEIGGTETHVHVAVNIVPTILVSDFVGQLKGGTAHEVNQILGSGGKILQWQTGYGVVSFGTKDIPWVGAYIREQRRHHARGTVSDRLERITSQEKPAQAKPAGSPVNGASDAGAHAQPNPA